MNNLGTQGVIELQILFFRLALGGLLRLELLPSSAIFMASVGKMGAVILTWQHWDSLLQNFTSLQCTNGLRRPKNDRTAEADFFRADVAASGTIQFPPSKVLEKNCF